MKNTKQLLYVCANCKRQANSEANNSTFKLCSGCYKVHYCNRECQLADRRIHKVACKAVQANDSNSTTTILNVDNLFECCRKGDLIGVKQEISQCTDLNAMLNLGWIMCTLIRSRCYECTELLLQHNANPNIRNIYGTNKAVPLHVACLEGYEEFVSLLLKYKADPHILYTNGYSILHMACLDGYDKCVSLLLQYNADPNIVCDKDGLTPLHAACGKGEDKCVLLLLLRAGANMECIDKSSFTPLLAACYYGHLKCVALLVEHGANIVQSSTRQRYVLILSCLSGNINLFAYILSLGVDVNIPDECGFTPIQYCHSYGLEKCVKLLIEHGADESTMRTPIPANLIKDNDWIKNEHVRTKEWRHKAKHCDYPDCCNEGDDSQSLHACSSCRAVYYCSREHQEAHWKEHKKLCKAIKK